MTDIAIIAKAYIDAWNETDPARRRALLETNWTADATYVDPIMAGGGRAEIAGLIAGVHERFPGFRFQVLGTPNRYGNHGRFSWGLGPVGAQPVIEGTDFVEIADGQLRKVTGFLDKIPTA